MNQKELLKYARELGLDAEESDSIESISSKIKAATGSTAITIPTHLKPRPGKGFKRIIIHEQQDDPRPVALAVQGIAWLIQRGVAVDVPESVVHALQNSVGTAVSMDPQTGKITQRQFARYPFQFV